MSPYSIIQQGLRQNSSIALATLVHIQLQSPLSNPIPILNFANRRTKKGNPKRPDPDGSSSDLLDHRRQSRVKKTIELGPLSYICQPRWTAQVRRRNYRPVPINNRQTKVRSSIADTATTARTFICERAGRDGVIVRKIQIDIINHNVGLAAK